MQMTEAMMERDDREVIRLVNEGKTADMGPDVIPTRRGFVRMPRIVEEEPAVPVPMDEDRELERLVNTNTAWYRQQEETEMEAEWAEIEDRRHRDREAALYWEKARRSLAALSPAALGTAVLGGMVQGWVDVVFASGLAAVCFAWTWLRLRRAWHGSVTGEGVRRDAEC
jgi:hypothetical protein